MNKSSSSLNGTVWILHHVGFAGGCCFKEEVKVARQCAGVYCTMLYILQLLQGRVVIVGLAIPISLPLTCSFELVGQCIAELSSSRSCRICWELLFQRGGESC